MNLLFATHNPNKVREFKEILHGIAEVEQLNEEYPEIQADTSEEVALESVKKLAEKYKKTIVVEDSGLFIDALKGFPGVYSSPIHKQIGLPGILKLMEGVDKRGAAYKSAVGYCEPGKLPLVFSGEEKGTIATSIRGTHGFGHDPIFIPEHETQTYGELADGSTKKQFRRRALDKLLKQLRGS
ncbi:MAG: RdgB/HAM1 family non-canonical purine NTP pyrophosphatase [Nanoarchaeota archaeon]|nr:RdgB/HAM1 family non-canonical purine NTP pyrophosphatase [Nanoarchaeota archaeon]